MKESIREILEVLEKAGFLPEGRQPIENVIFLKNSKDNWDFVIDQKTTLKLVHDTLQDNEKLKRMNEDARRMKLRK
ncbi:hypothetical protein OSF82_002298 [Enterococcus hirae]|uniref:hypothetical protein n=1 Tax=unclassified Enterococcus TaxID=2608891 RepID=UPI002EB318AB|nr:hypothetical protein [Enterococcus hirae]